MAGRYFYLTPMLGGPGAPRHGVNAQPRLIGRSEAADIMLLEPTVSRQHATVQVHEGKVLLKDLGSKHGTFVNSKRVTNTTLRPGDIVVFGLSLVLRLEESVKPLPTAEKIPAAAASQDYPEPGVNLGVTAIRTVTVPPRTSRRTVGIDATSEDIGRLQQQMAKLHKLASAGAMCLAKLPEVYRDLVALRAGLDQGNAESSAASTLDELTRSISVLISALGTSSHRQLVPLQLAELVQRAIDQVGTELAAREVRVTTHVASDLRVRVDPERLTHALSEIIRNAACYGPVDSLVEISAQRRGDETVLSIKDQGEGFPTEVLDRVFDPFVTRSADWEALGLGLFEARQIVMSFGGTLDVESTLGDGATVHLHFPSV